MIIPFLEGYREGILDDPSTSKKEKEMKLQVINDVLDFAR
jgi:hypothetical protein